jgi:DNA-binding NarL/FixJ family response regulator
VSEEIRVFVVDDHSLVRAGVRAEIGQTLQIVGEAADVASAVDGIRRTRPDVVLLDVHLPGGGGRRVLEAILATQPGTRFLAISVSEAAVDVIDIIRGGARGYVSKAISGEALCEAIRRVHDGDAYFSPHLAGFVLDVFQSEPRPGSGRVSDPDLNRLSGRERDVLGLIASGYTYREVGVRLHISARTVETHVSAVLRKLQLSNRHQLSRWAAARHLIEP